MTGTAAVSALEIVLPGIVEPDALQVRTRHLAGPAAGQVLLRVDATGVSFAEQQMRRRKYYGQPPFPFVPGYDAVGTVIAAGPDVGVEVIGNRFALVTKVGGWASHIVVEAADLVPVPHGVDAVAAETVVVNGVTAWQMLFRVAKVRRGQRIVVMGANGGVGSTLVQLARHHGIEVIGTASARHHGTVASFGAVPVDYRDPDMAHRIRSLAPGGVDAVFDHVGGSGLKQSWQLLNKRGTFVSYGATASKNDSGSPQLTYMKLFTQLWMWNGSPNGRHAHFYNFWTGHRQIDAFRRRLSQDLTEVFALLADGVITAQVAATIPLSRASEALALAESGTVAGKVILVPG